MVLVSVSVLAMSGNELAVLTVDRRSTVRDLKFAIHKAAKIPPNTQRLLLDNTILSGADVLDQAFPAEDAVQLTLVKVDKWIEEVANDWRRIRKAPVDMKNDPEVILEAIDRSAGEALKYAGEVVRADTEVVLAAMQHNLMYYRYATPFTSVCLNRDFVVGALRFVGSRDAGSHDKRGGQAWEWLDSPQFRSDREVMMLAVSAKGECLMTASPSFKADRELVLAAITSSPSAYTYASAELKADRELALSAVRRCGTTLAHAPEVLRDDEDFVRAALEGGLSSSAFEFLSPRLRAHREIFALACQKLKGPTPMCYASADIQDDEDMVRVALAGVESNCALSYIGPTLQANEEFLLSMVQQDPRRLFGLPRRALTHRRVVLAGLNGHVGDRCLYSTRGDCVRMIVEHHEDNRDIITVVMRTFPDAYPLLNEKLKLDAAIAAAAVMGDAAAFAQLPEALRGERAFVTEVAITKHNLDGRAQRALKKLHVATIVSRYILE